jgi:hypothetical protein
VKFKIA